MNSRERVATHSTTTHTHTFKVEHYSRPERVNEHELAVLPDISVVRPIIAYLLALAASNNASISP